MPEPLVTVSEAGTVVVIRDREPAELPRVISPGPNAPVIGPQGPQGIPGVPGDMGPAGPAGTTAGYEHTQSTPAATWTVTIPDGTFTRRPVPAVYIGNELVLADVEATATQVVVTFAEPQTGQVVLS